MLTKTHPLTINLPKNVELTPELEDVLAAFFDEYAERKSDERLSQEIQKSVVIDLHVRRIQELHAAWNI